MSKECRRCREVKDDSEFNTDKRMRDGLHSWCRECKREYNRIRTKDRYKNNSEYRRKQGECRKRYSRTHPEKFMLSRAKTRAKLLGLEFNLDVEDIVIPDYCQLLGIELKPGTNGKAEDSSPSIDRVDPNIGYIKGNVKVISHLANMIKNRASPDQIKTMAKNIDAYVSNKPKKVLVFMGEEHVLD